MNAPVGPPICTFEPPKSDTISPATIAVIIPFSGVTPDAIPNAIANGRATIPTIIPANKSVVNCFLLYVFNVENSFGLNSKVVIFSLVSNT